MRPRCRGQAGLFRHLFISCLSRIVDRRGGKLGAGIDPDEVALKTDDDIHCLAAAHGADRMTWIEACRPRALGLQGAEKPFDQLIARGGVGNTCGSQNRVTVHGDGVLGIEAFKIGIEGHKLKLIRHLENPMGITGECRLHRAAAAGQEACK